MGTAERFTLGERVRLHRQVRQLSQRELADSAEVDETTVWRIENGRARPNLETMMALARVLGVSVEELNGGNA